MRFHPRSDGTQRVVRFDVSIGPTPAGVTQTLDTEGNVVTMAWFDGLHDHLEVRATSEVETLRENPFDYLLTPRNQRLPITYEPGEVAQLQSAMRRVESPTDGDPVREMADQIRSCANGELGPFLSRLCETIYEQFEIIHRDEGLPWAPSATIDQRAGSCRDVTVLMMDMCRASGLAARFVSGYQEGDPDQDNRELHAWVEVYLPGAGWRGYDPTHGMAVADRHVTLAAAVDPEYAAPVTATFRGTGVESELKARVLLEISDSAIASTC